MARKFSLLHPVIWLQLGHWTKFPNNVAVLKDLYGDINIGDGNLCLQSKHLTVMLNVFASGFGSPLMAITPCASGSAGLAFHFGRLQLIPYNPKITGAQRPR